ncbi:NAD(P)H-dependent oxidoreductase [Glutamicibacter arilaitensis]|uniref:NAD(P)H-dependent oxidoreductase n=1 Tax=Glutamicibacter arilaitensis TaxID=256701 RepID=UPI003F8E8D4D
MKTLIIQGHPNTASFGQAVADAYQRGLRTHTGAENVREINLGIEDFDPVLRYGYRERMEPDQLIERSQADLAWADHLVIITPVWWTTFPSVLHGWFERVLTPGYAYRMNHSRPERLMQGKTASLIATSWAPGFYTRLIPNSPARLLRKHVLGICGIRLDKTHILGSMDGPKDTVERRIRFLEYVESSARKTGRR